MKVLISNIQRFSLHDGPGIRTTVFFMGCPLNCPWCCNPENKTQQIKEYVDEYGNKKTYGKYYSLDELKIEVLKDLPFYKSNGGVSYSGGEALIQLKDVKSLLKDLNELNVHQCLETTLCTSTDLLKEVIDFIDLFYVDLKILNKYEFKSKLNGNLDLLYSNLDYLKSKNKKFIFRIPLVKDYTLNEENIEQIKNIIKKYKPLYFEFFSVHNLAKNKYNNLNLKYQDFEKIDNEIIKKIKEYINN